MCSHKQTLHPKCVCKSSQESNVAGYYLVYLLPDIYCRSVFSVCSETWNVSLKSVTAQLWGFDGAMMCVSWGTLMYVVVRSLNALDAQMNAHHTCKGGWERRAGQADHQMFKIVYWTANCSVASVRGQSAGENKPSSISAATDEGKQGAYSQTRPAARKVMKDGAWRPHWKTRRRW